jgi:hypothetical protein
LEGVRVQRAVRPDSSYFSKTFALATGATPGFTDAIDAAIFYTIGMLYLYI